MNKLALLAASALIAGSAPAIGQTGGDTGAGTGGGAGAEAGASGGVTGGTGADTGAGTGAGGDMGGATGSDAGALGGNTAANNTSGGGEPSYQSFMTSLDATGDTVTEIESLDTVSGVQVISVSELEGFDEAETSDMMARSEDDLTSLRSAIEANPDIQTQLESQMMDGQEIVAADVDPAGNVIVYTR